ncbi:MAG: GIY-YIG nuclease family protein [Lewinellaceae bacterium]|nr:GIY-YIG nuclease family protein [Lewinellaceae bacterium]
MYFFYVLYSLNDHKLYKGFSGDIPFRLLKHFNGGVNSTRFRRPLVLIHLESFDSKQEAMARESWSKSLEGGSALKQLLVSKGILDSNFSLNLNTTG